MPESGEEEEQEEEPKEEGEEEDEEGEQEEEEEEDMQDSDEEEHDDDADDTDSGSASSALVVASADTVLSCAPYLAQRAYNLSLPLWLRLLLHGEGVLNREASFPSCPAVLLDLIAQYASFPVPSQKQWLRQLADMRQCAELLTRRVNMEARWKTETSQYEEKVAEGHSESAQRCMRSMLAYCQASQLEYYQTNDRHVSAVLRFPAAVTPVLGEHAATIAGAGSDASNSASIFLAVSWSTNGDPSHSTEVEAIELTSFRALEDARIHGKGQQGLTWCGVSARARQRGAPSSSANINYT